MAVVDVKVKVTLSPTPKPFAVGGASAPPQATSVLAGDPLRPPQLPAVQSCPLASVTATSVKFHVGLLRIE